MTSLASKPTTPVAQQSPTSPSGHVPALQQIQYPLPEPVVRRIVDFLLIDPEVVETKKDGGKKWNSPIVKLSMIDRATREYAWKYRLERLNLATCLKLGKHGQLGKGGLEGLPTLVEKEWEFVSKGVYKNLSTLYYTEKDKYLRFGFPFGERDPRNEDFQALIRRLWKFVGECPSAQSIINIPVYPPFFDYGMVFARVKELTHPGMMFGSAGATVGLRDYFPALETLRIRMCPSSPDAKEWKVKDVVDVSGVNEVIVEPVVFEEEGLFLDEFEPWPFHSKTGTKLIFAFPKGDLLVMHHDLNADQVTRMGKIFGSLAPASIDLDLSVKHHRTFGFGQTCTDAGGMKEPVRMRTGTKANRKSVAGRIAKAFPTCKTFRIYMKCTDPYEPNCFFAHAGSFGIPDEAELKRRSTQNLVDFKAEINHHTKGKAASLEIEETEDRSLIDIMDTEIPMDKYEDFYAELDADYQKQKEDVQASSDVVGAGGSDAGDSAGTESKRKRDTSDEGGPGEA